MSSSSESLYTSALPCGHGKPSFYSQSFEVEFAFYTVKWWSIVTFDSSRNTMSSKHLVLFRDNCLCFHRTNNFYLKVPRIVIYNLVPWVIALGEQRPWLGLVTCHTQSILPWGVGKVSNHMLPYYSLFIRSSCWTTLRFYLAWSLRF